MNCMDLLSSIPFLLVAYVPSRTRRSVAMLVVGLALAAACNLPWLADRLKFSIAENALLQQFSNPKFVVVANAAAAALIVWGLVRILLTASPNQRLVRTLISRGDFVGAAQLQAQEGDHKGALSLYRKGKAWNEAARMALDLGREADAAEMLRRAGGHHLGEAARLFRRSGDIAAAQRCDRGLAEWLTSRGRHDEAVEAWTRAGDPKRAAGAAVLALEEGRLSSSNTALPAARRAVEQIGDQRVLARLHELEGNWQAAAHAWRSAGEHALAAEIFRKAGLMHDAVVSETAAGHHREAAQMRTRQLEKLRDRLAVCEARGAAGREESENLRQQIEREEKTLIPILADLGMRSEMIEVIGASGRADEAVKTLVDRGEEAEAAELAINAQLWHLAAPLLERLNRWGEASDIYELSGKIEAAARCAEFAREDERALQLYRSLGIAEGTANCMARLGYLQDALVELHRGRLMGEAFAVLQNHPGPIPDIPHVVLDMAKWARENISPEASIACLQRAVIGVALQPGRLGPAVALAHELYRAGERHPALAQLERILAFDYSCEPARKLRARIEADRTAKAANVRLTAGEDGAASRPALAAQQRYEILTKLGRGGMGVVYKARDTRLERDVAIKVLRTTSPEEAARLGQEAKAAATLNHPGIVTVHDFEAGFDGYFIAMEFVPGEAMEDLLKRDPEQIRSRLPSLLLRIAEAIAYAHSRHVIHRDLKPGNILVTPDGEVKILDFGIAARLDRGDGEKVSISGTPFYMAPEQIRGQPPTPATDIYAFGATAFHLATGQPPFHTGNVIDAHLNSPPPDPLDLAPELDPGLAHIILRCLEKDPKDRYTATRELCADLETLGG
jgi:tRNA A-37 threonylcarbamoyl transferase component Bud32/tetratricopeptide (TPR) repeat protein